MGPGRAEISRGLAEAAGAERVSRDRGTRGAEGPAGTGRGSSAGLGRAEPGRAEPSWSSASGGFRSGRGLGGRCSALPHPWLPEGTHRSPGCSRRSGTRCSSGPGRCPVSGRGAALNSCPHRGLNFAGREVLLRVTTDTTCFCFLLCSVATVGLRAEFGKICKLGHFIKYRQQWENKYLYGNTVEEWRGGSVTAAGV